MCIYYEHPFNMGHCYQSHSQLTEPKQPKNLREFQTKDCDYIFLVKLVFCFCFDILLFVFNEIYDCLIFYI